MLAEIEWGEFKRIWGVSGMPRDKKRLAKEAWEASRNRVVAELTTIPGLSADPTLIEQIRNLPCFTTDLTED